MSMIPYLMTGATSVAIGVTLATSGGAHAPAARPACQVTIERKTQTHQGADQWLITCHRSGEATEIMRPVAPAGAATWL